MIAVFAKHVCNYFILRSTSNSPKSFKLNLCIDYVFEIRKFINGSNFERNKLIKRITLPYI